MSRQSCNKIISWFMHDPDINDQFVDGFIKAYFPHIDEPIHDVSLQHTDSSGRRRKKKEDIVNAKGAGSHRDGGSIYCIDKSK